MALSFAERDALAHHALVGRQREAAFASDRIDRWSRLATTTLLDHVEFVSDQRIEAVELFLLREIDLTPVFGRDVERLQRLDSSQVRLLRAPGWDRTYLLQCNPGTRWTNDPNFRRWLAERVDRVDLVGGLFDGHGSPAWSVQSRASGPVWRPPVRHPFSSTSRPVLRLRYDPNDRSANSIASRMKALFAAEGVDLRLDAGGDGDSPELTLWTHQRWSADPVEALDALVSSAGSAAQGAGQYLEQARAASGATRDGLAALAEDALLMDALVVPLVRLEAWVAIAPGLEGVQPGLTGELALGNIWWSR
jgi:ABC-type transport system substrate-binding protein